MILKNENWNRNLGFFWLNLSEFLINEHSRDEKLRKQACPLISKAKILLVFHQNSKKTAKNPSQFINFKNGYFLPPPTPNHLLPSINFQNPFPVQSNKSITNPLTKSSKTSQKASFCPFFNIFIISLFQCFFLKYVCKKINIKIHLIDWSNLSKGQLFQTAELTFNCSILYFF